MSKNQDAFRILVVDDEVEIVRDLTDLLADEGYEAVGAHSGQSAIERLSEGDIHLVLSDMRMPPPDGLALARHVAEHHPDTRIILLTAHADPDLAREAIESGAFDYVTKPWNTFELLLRVRRVRERWDLHGQRQRLERYIEHLTGREGEETQFEGLVARSASMREVFDLAQRVAASDATVLIRGESGTGKSVLAAAMHNQSPRAGEPFVKVNCGAIPENLLESELFGHEKGSFTGATRDKAGLFEVADRGTLFLDEIGDISLPVQVKLLQAIEEKSFLRVGGTAPIQSDVRIVAATHRDLETAIQEGDFREDLFYRLNVFPLVLPPLRDRREDLPDLVERFLKHRGQELTKMSKESLDILARHPFPGNIRELENHLERALILAGPGPIGPEHLPGLGGSSMTQVQASERLPEIPDEGVSLEELEKRYILSALEKTSGNKSRAAQLLGMTRRTLYSRMERHGIPV